MAVITNACLNIGWSLVMTVVGWLAPLIARVGESFRGSRVAGLQVAATQAAANQLVITYATQASPLRLTWVGRRSRQWRSIKLRNSC